MGSQQESSDRSDSESTADFPLPTREITTIEVGVSARATGLATELTPPLVLCPESTIDGDESGDAIIDPEKEIVRDDELQILNDEEKSKECADAVRLDLPLVARSEDGRKPRRSRARASGLATELTQPPVLRPTPSVDGGEEDVRDPKVVLAARVIKWSPTTVERDRNFQKVVEELKAKFDKSK